MKVEYIRIPSRYEKVYIDNNACITPASSFLNERGISSYVEEDDISKYLVVKYNGSEYIVRPESTIYIYKSTIISIDDAYNAEFSKFINKLTKIKF